MKNKKQIKREYKQKKPAVGVYQIRNLETGKVLIEGSTNLDTIWNRFTMELKYGFHRNKGLQKDWKKYGKESFEFTILSELEIDEEEGLDLYEEAKELKEMLLEEMDTPDELMY